MSFVLHLDHIEKTVSPITASFSKCAVLIVALALAQPLHAQDGDGGLTTRNPLDDLRDELILALEEADLPFDRAQEASIILALEESRLASEQLFGDVMDFAHRLWRRLSPARPTRLPVIVSPNRSNGVSPGAASIRAIFGQARFSRNWASK